MDKIIITIPDNLTKEQEWEEIALVLGKKMLPSPNKILGDGYEVKNLETQIIIKREPVFKSSATHNCSVCQTIFDVKLARPLWVNYGGSQKKRIYCSDDCRETVLNIIGSGRASIDKKDLKPVFKYSGF